MQKFIVFALGLALASAEDAKPQGRQMNWNNYKPNYLQTYPGSSYDSSENFGTGSVLNPQIKPSMGNFQGLNSPTLDGQDMNNRDGSLSHNAYGYDDASDQSNNGNAIGFGDEKQSSLVSALTTFLPVGLFLAAIVPNIITVSAGRRKRSEAEEARQARDEATFPILDMISSYGVRSLQEPSCQSKIFCEIGRMGGLPEANVVQRALWLTANYVPERVSSIIGADQLFRQIRSQKCSEFICSSE